MIDLDTVMPGSVLADFGDLARTAACPAPEDEPDLARVHVDARLYEALVRGYLAGAGALLEPVELALLPLAGPLIALETGIRFLTRPPRRATSTSASTAPATTSTARAFSCG